MNADTIMEPHKCLLETQEEWDDGLNPPTNEKTWNAAKDVLELLIEHASPFPVPMVDAAPNGDIHLFWNNHKDYFVLIIIDSENQSVKWFVRFKGAVDDPRNLEGTVINQESITLFDHVRK